MLSCSKCKYKCKKKTSLEKHMITKHEAHQCKECQEKLPSFMKLLAHIAEYHFQDQSEHEEKESKDDDIIKESDAKEEVGNVSGIEFDKALLGEFYDQKI